MAGVRWDIIQEPLLKSRNIGLDTIAAYAEHFHVPACHGKINPKWFDEHHLAEDHVRHFASDVLHMVPMLLSFMLDVVAPLGVLQRHIEGLDKLNKLLSFFLHCGRMTEARYHAMSALIHDHRSIFAELYGDYVKIKFHHAGHIARDLYELGICLSCFPLERKHRTTKALIVWAFKNCEMTCVHDYVNYAVQSMVEGRFQFVSSCSVECKDLRDRRRALQPLMACAHTDWGH